MNRPADTVFWLRAVAVVAVLAVAVSLVIQGADQLPWVLAGVALFAATLPWWPWIKVLPPAGMFAVMLGQGLVIAAGQFASLRPGTMVVLFFVLLSCCARLPRRYSLLCYPTFTFLGLVPYLIGSEPREGWSILVNVVPGFFAMIAFAEGFLKYQTLLNAKDKLLEELIAAQRRSELTAEAPPPPLEPGLLTRRDKEVLSLVAMGFSNKEIADQLFLAEGTVKNRVSQLLEKIGARDRTQAALRARDRGLL